MKRPQPKARQSHIRIGTPIIVANLDREFGGACKDAREHAQKRRSPEQHHREGRDRRPQATVFFELFKRMVRSRKCVHRQNGLPGTR